MTDVDIIPRLNSSSMINTFYNSISSKCQKYVQIYMIDNLK